MNGFMELSYINRKSDQLLAPTPLFIISEGITVEADQFHNPFGRDFIDVRRRMVEAGNRNFIQDIDTYRIVGGVEMSLKIGISKCLTTSNGWYRYERRALYSKPRRSGVKLRL